MCAGLLIAQLFAATRSFRNDRTFPTANFQLVAIRVLEEKSVVAGTVIVTDFRPFQGFPARLADYFRNPVHFFARVRPECNAGSIRLMVLVFRETKKFRGLVAARGIKSMEIVAWTFAIKSEL